VPEPYRESIERRAARTATASANVADDLIRTATRIPDAPALVRGIIVWSYARLLHEAASIAARYQALGLEPGARVAIVVGNRPHHVAAWYGTLMAGGIVVDISTVVGPNEWREILADAAPSMVVCDASVRDGLASVLPLDERAVVVVAEDDVVEATVHAADDPIATRAVGPDDAAALAYTSGTTGRPKGVVHTHRAIARQLDLLADLHRLSVGDYVYVAVPLFALHGFLPQVASAVRGGAAVLLADKFAAADFAATSRTHPITYVTLSSPMLAGLLDLEPQERPDLAALRVITIGGAPLSPERRAEFEALVGVHVTQGYGMTEVLGVYVADYGGAPYGSCGRQHPPTDPPLVVVLDDDTNMVPQGVVGELAVHRSCAMHEYWNDPHQTEQAFEGAWFRTGDIGRVDEDGFYFVMDRKKDVIIRGGFNIYSAEIERALAEHVTVAEAVVVAEPHQTLGEVPVAYVVLVDASDRDAVDLVSFARAALGPIKAPSRIEVVGPEQLPRNAIGKVLKRQLREMGPVRAMAEPLPPNGPGSAR